MTYDLKEYERYDLKTLLWVIIFDILLLLSFIGYSYTVIPEWLKVPGVLIIAVSVGIVVLLIFVVRSYDGQ